MKNDNYKPTNLSPGELAFLGGVWAYPLENGKVEEIGDWEKINFIEDPTTGLELYAVKKNDVDEITFVIRGSDEYPNKSADWGGRGANVSFTGAYHPQMRKAVEEVAQFVKSIENKPDLIDVENCTFSLAAHSKGAGIAQLIAYIFGFDGVVIDSAPASKILDNPEFIQHLKDLKIVPKGAPKGFVNIIEKGSLVGDILENGEVCLGPVNVKTKIALDIISVYTELHYEIKDGKFYTGAGEHIGTTVRVDLADGSCLDEKISKIFGGILEQHDPFDDALALAKFGIIGTKDLEIRKIDSQIILLNSELAELKNQIDKASVTYDFTEGILNGSEVNHFIQNIEKQIQGLEEQRIIVVEEFDIAWQEIYGGYGDIIDPIFKDALIAADVDIDALGYLQDHQERDAFLIKSKLLDIDNELINLQSKLAIELQALEYLKKEDPQAYYYHKFNGVPDEINLVIEEKEKEKEEIQKHLDKVYSRLNDIQDYLPDDLKELVNDNDSENAYFDGFNQQQQQADNPNDSLVQSDKELIDIAEESVPTVINFENDPGDPGVYFLYSNGKIVRSAGIAGENVGGYSENINGNDLPLTKEQLLNQLLELGVSKNDAEALVSGCDLLEVESGGLVEFGENGNDSGVVSLEERIHQIKVETGELIRANEVKMLQAKSNLYSALESGDGIGIIKACFDYYASIEQNFNVSGQGNDSAISVLEEENGSIVESLSSIVAFGQALEDGDGLSIAGRSIDLLKNIDNYLETNGNDFGDIIGTNGSSFLGFGEAGINLAQAIESGDDWSTIQSSINLLKEVDQYLSSVNGNSSTKTNIPETAEGFDVGTALKGLGSAVGLAINISQMDDVLESGNAAAIASTVASTINNAINTYNAAANLVGVQGVACNNIPYLGYVTAVFMALDGDVQGAGEQAVITAATSVLSAIPVYGWIAALALQVASATRGFDGQILDKESVEDAMDDWVSGLGEFASLKFSEKEIAAEIGERGHNILAKISGFNLDFYDQNGIEIPEEMRAEFAFNQIMFENADPMHVAKYLSDLDEVSLSDMWASTNITPAVSAWIEEFENTPDFVVSTFTKTPQLTYEIVRKTILPKDVFSMFTSVFDDDPPEAAASFYIDENGNLQVNVSGDSSMQESAAALAEPVIGLMEEYRDNGGRLVINGSLPSLRVISGEQPRIVYDDDNGGRIVVELDNASEVLVQMQGVMYARDRGERLDTAVKVSTDVSGEIDFGKVDAIMAGYGFVKRGNTYTYGETESRVGFSVGSGVFRGGGNVGPEGQLFTATSDNFKSLPIPIEQLPSQKMNEINKIISGNNLFTGNGTDLLAMALIFPGGLAAPATAEEQKSNFIDDAYVKPLGPFDCEYLYPQQEQGAQQSNGVFGGNENVPLSEFIDYGQLSQILKYIGLGHLDPYEWLDESWADAAYYFKGQVGNNYSGINNINASWYSSYHPDILMEQLLSLEENEQGLMEGSSKSFSGYWVSPDALADQDLLDDNDMVMNFNATDGPLFVMAEDSILRFLPLELVEDTLSGGYSSFEDNYTFVSFGQVENGSVWVDDQGDIRFEPFAGFVGTGSFTYSVRNTSGEIEERTATIMVQNVNDQPVLQDDNYILQEGEILYLESLLANDSDPEGDSLHIDHLRGFEHGEVSLLNGRLAFVPDEGYFGNVEFSYWVRDHLDSYPVPANVVITYLDVNNGVTANDDRFLILENNVLATSVEKLLANDIEYDGESITFDGISGAEHGNVTVFADGTIHFAPDQDYSGNEAGFSYRVRDESGNITTGYASVEVVNVRDIPVVVSNEYGIIEEDEIVSFTPDEVAKFVFDADGDNLHLSFVSNIVGGSFIIQNGYYTFVPETNYFGQASFDYTVSDNHGGTANGHLDLVISPVNDAIDTGDDQLNVIEDNTVITSVNDLLANDTDIDGNDIFFIGLGATNKGNAVLDSSGNIIFTPDLDYVGSDAGFEYLVKDDQGLESTGWVRVAVNGENDPPEIIDNTLSLQEDQEITFDSTILSQLIQDVDGDQLTAVAVEDAVGGIIREDDGIYTFIPDLNYNGAGSVRVTVTDGNGETITTVVDLDILAVDDPADCGIDQFVSLEEQPFLITVTDLMSNDNDADGQLEFVGLGQGRHGSVSVNNQGEIIFIPDADYFGTDAGFTYLVKDPQNNEAEGMVTINVQNSNDPPEITVNYLVGYEDTPIVFDAATISKFVSDIDGDTITLTTVTGVTGGTVALSGSTYTFTPDSDFHGTASLAYIATDGNGEQVSGVLSLDLLSVDDPTLFGDDTYNIIEEKPLVTSVNKLLANDSDADGTGLLTFIGLSEVRHGSVNLATDGTITFLPTDDYFGGDAGFAYRVRDNEGVESTGWVTVNVSNENDLPYITGNRLFIMEDEKLVFTEEEVAKFLFDADNDPLHLDMVTNVDGGRVELQNGVYTFIPDQDFYGDASFDYRAVNSSGEQVTSHLSIGIIPQNDLPTTTPLAVSGLEDQEITLQVSRLMAGTNDVEDGADIRFDFIDSSLNGDVYVDSNGVIHFLPVDDFFGTGSFMYNVLDTEGGIGKGYVEVSIAGVNDAPVAMDDDKILAWSNNQYDNIFPASVFLANDYDADLDSLQLDFAGNAEYGTINVDANGMVHYVAPVNDWVGIDTFTYRISDGNGGFSEADVKIDVKSNTSPDVYSELLFTSEDMISFLSQDDLLANDSDIDGDRLQIIAVDQAEHCNVELNSEGNIIFTPEQNFNNRYPGQASFRYTVSDGISAPVTAIALFDIDPVNDKPILTPERITGAVEDNSFAFVVSDLIANDTDIEMVSDYEEDSIFFAGAWGALHGSISYDQNGGTIYYVPNANFCGTEQFAYGMIDSYGDLSVINSQIYVQPVNDLPVVQEDIGSAAEEYIWNYYSINSLVSNDYDVDGDSLSVSNPRIVDGNGAVSISGGNLAVKPAIGEDHLVIEYTVSDGHGGEVLSRLTIPQILDHNFAPQFTNLYRITYRDSSSSSGMTNGTSSGGATIFSFQVKDENGGDSWVPGNMGDIASISVANLRTNYPAATLTQESGYSGHFKFWYLPVLNENTDYYATFTITASDYSGATGTIFVDFEKMQTEVGPIYTYQYSPVVLDLDGDGVELLSIDEGITFDWNYDQLSDSTGWVAPDDGLLAYDYDDDGQITKADELSLKDYAPDAVTDLEGLRAFDSNEDGFFDSDDAEWGRFGVWQDKNSDGKTDDGEFADLNTLEINSIKLKSDEVYEESEGNYIYGTTTYQLDDGTVRDAADVGLTGDEISIPDQQENQISVDIIEDPLAEEDLFEDPVENEDEDENDNSLKSETEESEMDLVEEDTMPDPEEMKRIYEQLISDVAATEENIEDPVVITFPDPVIIPDLVEELPEQAEVYPTVV